MVSEYEATDAKAVGERLSQLREAMGMSSADFAKFLGFPSQTLSNYEVGYRRPLLEQAFVIVRRTGATLDWLYRGDRSGLPVRIASKLPVEARASTRAAG